MQQFYCWLYWIRLRDGQLLHSFWKTKICVGTGKSDGYLHRHDVQRAGRGNELSHRYTHDPRGAGQLIQQHRYKDNEQSSAILITMMAVLVVCGSLV